MMRAFARLVAHKTVAMCVVIAVFAVTAVLGSYAMKVDQDDDLLAFLPPGNADVAMFRQINEHFGGLDVGIVGIEVDDPFDGKFLRELEAITKKLNDEESIAYALSIANVEDFTLDEEKGGFRADYLVRPIPDNAEQSAALRTKVMSKEHIVGNLISPDGKAVIIYAFLAPEAKPRPTANAVRALVGTALEGKRLYWGGAPFVSTYIYDTTQGDMKRLIPWSVAVIVLLIVVSFRDLIGASLALVSTGMGIVVAYGLMQLSGVEANIVLGSMPVILFAVGSAYAIHVLVRYYDERADKECEEALVDALVDVGPTVMAAGLTTVAGLLSFMAMDIQPMRDFGLFTGLGILTTLLLSLTFVPAVVRLTNLKSRRLGKSLFQAVLTPMTQFAHRRRTVVMAVIGVLAVGGAAFTFRVGARMENAAFFSKGSPPDLAEQFLRDQFGGSQFIQIMVEGDMNDPGVLRELQRLADVISLEPHVSSVTHVGQVLSLVNEAFSGERRIPVTAAQVRTLFALLAGRPAVSQLVDEEKKRALLMVKIDTDEHEPVTTLLERIEAMAETEVITAYRVTEDVGRSRVLSAARIASILKLSREQSAAVEKKLAEKPAEADRKEVRRRLMAYLGSDESLLEDEQRDAVGAIADGLVAIGAAADETQIRAVVAKALPPSDDEDEEGADHDELVEDIAKSVMTPVSEIWRQTAARGAALQIVADLPADKIDIVAAAMLDAQGDHPVLLPADGEAAGNINYIVNGTPVLYRGLSNSVTANQFASLGLALALVLVIMVALFRSLLSGLLAAVPTVLTLLVIYGFMGARGMHLDIGTSMLASIIIGAGVDYAVHLLAAWRAEKDEPLSVAAERAAAHAGPAIWINALMVAAGFFVLTLGEARPLQNVGGLTSAAMLTAAFATFLALPALARKRAYRVEK
jgi:predicted RND superfamily exporter protein